MFDIHQDIQNEYGEIEEERTQEYMNGLMEEFNQSSEWLAVREKCGDSAWAATMMHYATEHLGSTPAEMTLSDFNEVLFQIFPRKVSVKADEAGLIIAELRAFWSFLARQYGLENAREILETLDDSAVSRLRDKLADPANFGMAKSFFMLGTQAGYDMTTQKGLEAFQVLYNTKMLENRLASQQPERQYALKTIALPEPDRRDFDELKKKRKEKKRQREAKRRNRPK
jgi:hypothetical protein